MYFKYVPITFLLFILLLSACKKEKDNQQNSIRKVTIDDVEAGIRQNIAERLKKNDGFFTYQNDSTSLKLKLVRVHTEYLSVLGDNEFFACVDLATEDGDVYDVDFFLNGDADNMKISKTDIHKLNGKPFYTWKQAKDKTWQTVPVKDATEDLLGMIGDKDEFIFNYKAYIPQINDSAELWIPIADSDNFQKIDILSIEMPADYKIIRDNTYNNKILYAKLNPEQSQMTIEIKYKVERKEKSAYVDPDMELDFFLSSSALIPVGDRFGMIAAEAIAKSKADNPLSKARALYDYIIDNMRYAKQGKYGTGDANFACDTKSGNCTEFHSLFISLARSVNIPARFAIGAAIPSERDEGGVNGYHCWAEFYANGKWWPVDISEANKYSALATYYFGHHPANRIELSRGRDIMPEPGPKTGAINFFAYPVLEENNKRIPVKVKFSFQRQPRAEI